MDCFFLLGHKIFEMEGSWRLSIQYFKSSFHMLYLLLFLSSNNSNDGSDHLSVFLCPILTFCLLFPGD